MGSKQPITCRAQASCCSCSATLHFGVSTPIRVIRLYWPAPRLHPARAKKLHSKINTEFFFLDPVNRHCLLWSSNFRLLRACNSHLYFPLPLVKGSFASARVMWVHPSLSCTLVFFFIVVMHPQLFETVRVIHTPERTSSFPVEPFLTFQLMFRPLRRNPVYSHFRF